MVLSGRDWPEDGQPKLQEASVQQSITLTGGWPACVAMGCRYFLGCYNHTCCALIILKCQLACVCVWAWLPVSCCAARPRLPTCGKVKSAVPVIQVGAKGFGQRQDSTPWPAFVSQERVVLKKSPH